MPERRPAAIVLAAGTSTRFEGTKLLATIDGKTLVERALDAVPAPMVSDIVLVLGAEANGVARVVGPRKAVRIVVNQQFRKGLSTSIRAGLAALSREAPAAMFVLADQPFVTRALVRRALRTFEEDKRKGALAAAAHGDLLAPPVIFSKEYFRELRALRGDQGAKAVIVRHLDRLSRVRVRSSQTLADIDTREDLGRAVSLLEP